MTASISLMVAILSVAGFMQSWWLTKGLMAANSQIASVYMEAIIAPHVLAGIDVRLADTQRRAIEMDVDALMRQSGIRAVTLWRLDGTVVFSTLDHLTEQRFESDDVREAALGRVVQDLMEPSDHNGAFRAGEEEMVEIYIPIRDSKGQVVAVGEFYQSLSSFRDVLAQTLVGSWSIRIFFSLLAILTLFLLVRKASTTIKRQRLAIRRQAKSTVLYRQEIEMLRARADRARHHAAQASEMLLSRIGAEIHDGPVQTLTLAMLQVGHLEDRAARPAPAPAGPPPPAALLTDAISQLRSMSAGLILPELEELTLEETILLVVARHERLTGTSVRVSIDPMPETSLEMRACIFRVVQEALNNAVRHAGGRGQSVEAHVVGDILSFTIRDEGPGFSDIGTEDGRPRLGLLAARHRAQTFGGTITVESRVGHGTRVVATFPGEAAGSLKRERDLDRRPPAALADHR